MLRGIRLSAFWLTALISFECGTGWAGGEEKILRSPKTPCGYYLTRRPDPKRKIEDTKGTPLTLSLDPAELSRWIENQPDESPVFEADSKIVAVGAPFAKKPRQEIEEQTRAVLRERGYKDVPVESIRRYISWSEEARGVFQQNAEGEWVKVSGIEPGEVREALRTRALADETPTLMVGAPVLGKNAARYEDFLAQALEQYDYALAPSGEFKLPLTQQTVPGAVIGRMLKHPVDTIKHLWERARSLVLFREDYQVPTQAESRNAIQKLLVPGLLTATVLLGKGTLVDQQAIEVVLPIMLATPIANGVNSYLTGYFRSTLQNWIRRSRALFPDQYMKDLMLSALFTPAIYFGGDPTHWSGVFSQAAWETFLATKTLSMLFNAGWRAPNNAVIASWERYAVERLGSTPTEARDRGSAIGKYTSYVMTQFYILSLFVKSSMFKVGYGHDGIELFGDVDLPPDMVQLMAFNFGHAFMFGVGTLSAALSPFRSVQTRVAEWAYQLDQKETRLVNWIFRNPEKKPD